MPNSIARKFRSIDAILLALCSAFFIPNVVAQTVESERGKLIRAPNAITVLGPELFGDSVNIYTGSLEFVQTDVNLPGNNQLVVAAGRKLTVGGTGNLGGGLFAHWDLDIPRIYGTFSSLDGWRRTVNGAPSTARCTNFGAPPFVMKPGTNFKMLANEMWHGNMLYVPGSGSQEILRRNTASNSNIPSDGVATPLVTKNHWAIRCLPSLASTNATTPGNEFGEGFLAISPDGTQYRFDWLVSRPAEPILKRVIASPGAPKGESFNVPRLEVSIFPTLITDRFGNTVRYTYDLNDKQKVLSIKSADGAGNAERVLSFTYTNRLIQSISDGTRTWTYTYGSAPFGTVLSSVQLPDNSTWNFAGMIAPYLQSLLAMKLEYNGAPDWEVDPYECDPFPQGLSSLPVTGSMVHPSGATGTFTMSPTQGARNNVPVNCAFMSRWHDQYSLTDKTITGPGLPSMTWTTLYEIGNSPGFECTSCGPFEPSIVTVTNPKGEVTRHTFGNTYGKDEGLPKRVDVGWNSSSAVQTTVTRYSDAFPDVVGFSDQYRGDTMTTSRHVPVDKRVITQQGVDFTWMVASSTDFDRYRRPFRTTRFSSLGIPKNETITYNDNTSKWILGQVEKVVEASSGKMVIWNEYNPITSNLEKVTRFGQLETTKTYHPDGTIASNKDGRNNLTTYSNYKRGIPRTTIFADATSEMLVVDDIGKITSATDQNGFTTGYKYDALGRLELFTPPAGDVVAWNPTSASFQQISTTEYSLAPGHWKQTITTGNGRMINYFDAMWRPVYAFKSDLNNEAATSSIVKNEYDFEGRKTFSSYPKRNYGDIGGGVRTEFDSLGRPTATKSDSEHGVIEASKSYGNNFTTTSRNARGFETTTSFQVFDSPSEASISKILMPLGVSVEIARDIFGKASSIKRSGNTKSVTKYFVYDPRERLCKTIEPEVGVTVQDYDLANNVAWRASGLALLSPAGCDGESVAAASKTTYSYDQLNRLSTTTYGDLSPGITRTYTPDSLPATIITQGADSTNWTYAYNRRRMNTTETLGYGGNIYSSTKQYDGNGALASLIYPDGTNVTFNPNGIGQPTQVGVFASAVTYHPNGAVKGFSYGNGIVHSLTQSIRGLPGTTIDTGVLNDVYAFNVSGSVSSIGDQQENIANRTMTYDELERLSLVNAPSMWGAASYVYDELDNLTSSTLTTGTTQRSMTHNYASDTQRLMSISGTAGFGVNYGYDGQGNVTQRGSQLYVFDQANRMKQATGKATYIYDGWGRRTSVVGTDNVNRVQMYALDGKLMISGPTTGIKTKFIYLHNHLIAEVGTSGTEYIHTDGLGSPVARTNTLRALISRTRYEPYGATSMGTAPTIGFTGHVNDIDTGLTYMQQRYYDPLAGRMLSIDPVTTDASNGGSFNRYAYANNNPYTYIDPDGRQSICAAQISCDTLLPSEMPALSTGTAPIRGGGGRAAAAAAATLTVMVVKTALTNTKNKNDDDEKVYVTYVKIGPKGEHYIGRTSGRAGESLESIVERRDKYHHMNLLGYGKAKVDVSAKGDDGYFAIRGREQMGIEYYGGVNSSDVGNSLNGIWILNPLRDAYMQAGYAKFGDWANSRNK